MSYLFTWEDVTLEHEGGGILTWYPSWGSPPQLVCALLQEILQTFLAYSAESPLQSSKIGGMFINFNMFDYCLLGWLMWQLHEVHLTSKVICNIKNGLAIFIKIFKRKINFYQTICLPKHVTLVIVKVTISFKKKNNVKHKSQ